MATTPTPTKPVALTVGQSLAHMSRAKIWATAILSQLMFPVFAGVSVYVNLLYAFPGGPCSFLAGVPWRLALVLACCAYLSVLFLVKSYAELYLPRTPMAVAEKMMNVGFWGVGVAVLGLMVSTVLALQVNDSRVLAACTAVPAAFIVGLVAFWVWLASTYGGASESSGVARLPV